MSSTRAPVSNNVRMAILIERIESRDIQKILCNKIKLCNICEKFVKHKDVEEISTAEYHKNGKSIEMLQKINPGLDFKSVQDLVICNLCKFKLDKDVDTSNADTARTKNDSSLIIELTKDGSIDKLAHDHDRSKSYKNLYINASNSTEDEAAFMSFFEAGVPK